jgi:hypothetical protein
MAAVDRLGRRRTRIAEYRGRDNDAVPWRVNILARRAKPARHTVGGFSRRAIRLRATWEELETIALPGDAPSPLNGKTPVVRIGGQHGFEWPAASEEIQECVTINFDVDLRAISEQDPMQFDAIKPIGPYYEYRDYGFVQSLQETIRALASD